ncbi:unnamed protein product [Arabidopsis lyrata]|nr:unnamed protein product [Arabidopsis lyrata]
MTPNLRSIVAQGLRSIRSRRNFSSSPGSSNEMYDFLVAAKTKVIPSFKTFDAGAWTSTGFLLYVGKEYYLVTQFTKQYEAEVEIRKISRGQMN